MSTEFGSVMSVHLFHSCYIFVSSTKMQVGYDKGGMPIGLQIMGRPWAEATVLTLAAAVEVHKHSLSLSLCNGH